ncbi:hypothetical protein DV515_00008009 [Chloebia gouldiae]|uniref:Uncharacterized protein n=1 Tax=Chloebia gouldiae TaxID=44316 RepID=A0A3L8SFN7_CHLGU|nr:hypothetical protein DV515_00008009 [Chloebia gouldiae]
MKDMDLPVERSMTDIFKEQELPSELMTNRAGEQCQHYHACGDTTCSDMGLESCSSRSGEGAGPSGSWKREYRSSTFNRNKGCSQMYTNGRVKTNKSPTYLGSSIYSQAHHGDGDGLRKDLVPLALPLLGKAHVKRPWGIEMRGSGLHLSTLPLSRVDLSTRASSNGQYTVLKVE